MLGGDVAELDRLLGEALVFTNHDGARLTKDDDLSAYRSGLLRIERLEVVGTPIVRQLGECAVVCVTADLTGRYAGHAFGGAFAYSRVWHRTPDGWRVEAGHCSAVTPSP